MSNLFFSPKGEISPNEFRKGAVILLALNFFLWLTWFVSFGLAMFASFVALITLYCWACLFIKRLRYAGVSELFYLMIFGSFMFALVLIVPVIMNIILPVNEQSLAMALELTERTTALQAMDNPTIEDIRPSLDLLIEVNRLTAFRQAITFFLSGAFVAFGMNRILKG